MNYAKRVARVTKNFPRLVRAILRLPNDVNAANAKLNEMEAQIRFLTARAEMGSPDPDASVLREFAVDVSKISSKVWPPYRAYETANSPQAEVLRAAADAIARVVEHMEFGACRTLAEFLPAPRTDCAGGPIIIACATLDGGGAEKQAALTARGLAARGERVIFAGFCEGRILEEQFHAHLLAGSNVEIVNVADCPKGQSISQHRFSIFPPFVENHISRYLSFFEKVRPKVVHAWLDYTNTTAGLAALLAGVPRVVLGLRNVNPSHFKLYQPLFRPVYSLACEDPRTAFICNSRAGAVDYARWLNIDPDRINVVQNAYVPEARAPEMVDGGPAVASSIGPNAARAHPLVLGVFGLREEKDPLLFVRSAKLIAERVPGARFAILGGGSLLEDVRDEVARCGLDKVFQLPGARPDAISWMRNSTLLMHSARMEGLPNVLIEAQAAGLPIAAIDAGGVREAVLPDVTAALVATRTPERLAAAAIAALENPSWLARARREGPLMVESRFALNRMIDSTLRAYEMPSACEPAMQIREFQ